MVLRIIIELSCSMKVICWLDDISLNFHFFQKSGKTLDQIVILRDTRWKKITFFLLLTLTKWYSLFNLFFFNMINYSFIKEKDRVALGKWVIVHCMKYGSLCSFQQWFRKVWVSIVVKFYSQEQKTLETSQHHKFPF